VCQLRSQRPQSTCSGERLKVKQREKRAFSTSPGGPLDGPDARDLKILGRSRTPDEPPLRTSIATTERQISSTAYRAAHTLPVAPAGWSAVCGDGSALGQVLYPDTVAGMVPL